MLLSYTVWQSRYGGDRAIIGRTIRANSEPATIVGVMPPGMEFPFNSDVWLPLAQRPTAQTRAGRAGRLLMAYGRLADGMTIEQARTEMTGITGQLAVQFPDTNKGVTAVVTPFSEQVIGTQIRVLFWSLMGAVAFVLLIACANVANLLLARAADRSREMAVRISIGATRWRIVRQLLVESVLLAFVAGVAGLGLAYAGVRWFDANTADIGKPYWMVFSMDGTVVAFFAAVCLVTGIVFGLAPALYVSRTSVSEVMKDGGRAGSAGMRARRWTTGADRGGADADARAALGRRADDSQLHEPLSDGHRRRHVAARVDAADLPDADICEPGIARVVSAAARRSAQRHHRHRGSELDELPAVQRRIAAAVRDRRTGGHDGRATAARRHGGGRVQILRRARACACSAAGRSRPRTASPGAKP